MASSSSASGITNETRDKNGLCLLSLDGGGVRGLSTLLILKRIMQQVNTQRQREGLARVRPCDVFDLIGGTSTGGLIAIMLGRLQMDIDECINAYSELSRNIFSKKGLPLDKWGNIKGKYKASELGNAVKTIIRNSGTSEDAPLDDGTDRGCRVFVCAVRKENTAVARLRSYQSHIAFGDGKTIWEAARATSAASGFFDPITIGKHGQEYVDAGLGCNNPVDEVWTEAQDIWLPRQDDLAVLVKCFISIGTGNPGTSPIESGALKFFKNTLKDIVTQTERTAENFEKIHRGLFLEQRYFRFNVDQGLQNVGLEEYDRAGEIASATETYMDHFRVRTQMENCSQAMKDKEFWKGDFSELMKRILREHQQGQEHLQGWRQFHLLFSLAAAPEIDYFVGRASSLALIESALLPFNGPERRVVVLHGLGGIGKSQLAIEFAKKHRSDYTAVLWLNAKTESTLKRGFAANASRLPKGFLSQGLLDGPQNEEALSSILLRIKTWLDLPGNDRWLLIFDNVDNPKIPDNKREDAYDVRSYFPEAHQGSILVTTRWRTLRLGHLVEVAKLSDENESISLLDRMCRGVREDPKVGDLVKQLDGLPLALATAGAYLHLTGISASEYLGHYKKSWLELQRTSPSLPSYEDQTIYSTWNLSYIYIRKESMSAAKLLELWAYFDNRDVWYDLLKAGEDGAPDWFLDVISTELAFISVIGTLRKHALIEKLTESNGYAMHHCVHAWVVSVLCKAVDDQNMRLALTCVGEMVPVEPARDDWVIRQRLILHAEKCLQLVHVWNDECKYSEQTASYITDFFSNLGHLYQARGKLVEAESMFKETLAAREKTLGSEHELTLSTVHNLGSLYYDQGKLKEAESMYQRALTGYEKALGKDHTSTLETVNNLGVLYEKQDKLMEAESMFQRALTGKQKALGRDHISTLNMVHNLGVLYWKQDKLTEAESMYQRALIGYEKALGKDHQSTLETVNSLGVLYTRQGKLTEAESMYQRALTGSEKALGKDHTSTLDTVNNLGNLYRRQGKLTEAESMYQRALTGSEKALGKDHTSTLDTVNNLGILYRRQGKLTEAESMYQRALTGREKALGKDHHSTLGTVYNLGNLYSKQGHLAEAESMYQRALLGYARNSSPNVGSQLVLLYNMGLLYRAMEKFESAKDYFRQAHDGYQKLLGSQHAETIDAWEQLNIEIERDTEGAESLDEPGKSWETG